MVRGVSLYEPGVSPKGEASSKKDGELPERRALSPKRCRSRPDKILFSLTP